MARSTHDFVIEGRAYRFTSLPARVALDVFPRLLHLVGRDLFRLILADDGVIDRALDTAELRQSLLLDISSRAQNGEAVVLADVCEGTQVRTSSGAWEVIDVDDHLADLSLLFDVAVQCVIGSFARPLPEGSPSQSSPDIRA